MTSTLYQGLPSALISDEDLGLGRIKADNVPSAFYQARMFRFSYEFDLTTTSPQYLKIEFGTDVTITRFSTAIDAGGLKLTRLVGGTESTSFSSTIDVLAKNSRSDAPSVANQTTVSTGGTLSAEGTVRGTFRLRTSGATAQRQTVTTADSDLEGLPAGTYYLKLETLDSTAPEGDLSIAWEQKAT